MLRLLLATVLAVCLISPPAAAADIPFSLEQYQHTRWTQENGGPPQIVSMAQTPDGWLWLATIDGLYRFDGVSFTRITMPGPYSPNRSRATALHAHDNGDLYISYTGQGLSVLHADGRFEDLTRFEGMPRAPISSMAVDRDGSLWVSALGVYHLKDQHWSKVDAGPELGASNYLGMLHDQDDNIWVASELGVWRLDRASGRFVKASAQGGGLAQTPGGAVWLISRNGAGATRLAASTTGARPRGANPAESRNHGLFDARGMLWGLKCGGSLCLTAGADGRGGDSLPYQRDGLDPQGALRGKQLASMLEDREGNLWIATQNSLERFRQRRLLPTGLDLDGDAYNLAADGDGRLWAAELESGKLWLLKPGQTPELQRGVAVQVLATAADGALLLGTSHKLIRRGRDGDHDIPLPPSPLRPDAGLHLMGVLDDGKRLWAASLETGLIAWDGQQWRPGAAYHMPPHIVAVAKGGPGQLWLSTIEGQLVFYNDGKLTTYDSQLVGPASAIFPGPAPVIAGERGMAVLSDGKLRPLSAANPRVLRNVSGIAVDAEGDRWLNAAAGVVHVRAADWQRALSDPATPLRYEVFDALDGYPGQAALNRRGPTAFAIAGHQLWFLGSGGVVSLDTQTLRRNRVAPAPLIQNVITESGTFAASGPLRLPPGSQQLQLNFTAAALGKPEGVQFQYRLDGVDRDWQDAGARRMTMYTNLAPGDYNFRVRAVNEDGTPSRADASLPLSVAPTLVQSLPFRIAGALALLALAVVLYRYRIKRLTARLMERLVVKTTERERIARMLHDTILQTVQGLMLKLDALAAALPSADPTRRQLEQLIDQASGAISEGRDQVHELRAHSTRTLEEVLADLLAGQRELHPALALDLRLEGTPRALHAALVEEAGQIAGEALRNACRHAQATQVLVRLAYGRRGLTVAVEDNGRGLDEQVARDGHRSGHWGMLGMRERAERLGARLRFESGRARGLTVTLTVPAARAYAG